MGLSMLPASTAPSAAPAPTIVCSSSMKTMTWPWASAISLRTALSRSSNSPRYLAPATIAPMSSAISLRSRSDSGTSPETMRWARPSTIAVLPTPGSPMSTGLFLVRRERTWMTRRISSSRPMTGSSLPCSAASVRSRPNFSSAPYWSSALWLGHAVRAADLGHRLLERIVGRAGRAQRVAGLGLGGGEREQQVLGRDVLVLELAHRLLGGAQHSDELVRRARGLAALATHRGQGVERGVGLGADGAGVGAELLQDGDDDARVLLEQDGEQVLGRELRVAAALCELLRGLEGLLGFDRKAVCLHISCLNLSRLD